MRYLILFHMLLASGMICSVSVATVPAPQTELNIYAVAPVTPEPTLTSEDVARFIPTDLNSNSSNEDLMHEMGKKTLRAFTKSNFIKKSVLGKTAESIKASTSTEISSGSKASTSAASAEVSHSETAANATASHSSANQELQHKMKFSLDPYKAEARMKYSGYFNGSAFYDVMDQDLKLEIEEQLDVTSFKLQHSTKEQLSTVLLGWTW